MTHDYLPKLASLLYSESWPEPADGSAKVLPKELFHYTSAEACFSILDVRSPDKSPVLWASSALCMNDSSEIEYGIDQFRRVGYDYFSEWEVECYLTRNHATNEFEANRIRHSSQRHSYRMLAIVITGRALRKSTQQRPGRTYRIERNWLGPAVSWDSSSFLLFMRKVTRNASPHQSWHRPR
jgi:hypothetical protein